MGYLSVKDNSIKFGISESRIKKLCEKNRISDAKKISDAWIIPEYAQKPANESSSASLTPREGLTLKDVCSELNISEATGRNWLKLGKLTSSATNKKTPLFAPEYVAKLKSEIESGENRSLKSRRNKKFISGFGVYSSYISSGCKGISAVKETIASLAMRDIEVNNSLIATIVSDAAVQMLSQKFSNEKIHLKEFLSKGTHEFYSCLIMDMIGNVNVAWEYIHAFPQLFRTEYSFQEKEDILGLLYISCTNIGNRKATGSYYTPTYVVRKMISRLCSDNGIVDKKILDPCCGTGNFLLQLSGIDLRNVYGNDADSMSVMITRINMTLKYMTKDLNLIYKNFTISDYLLEYVNDSFDYIIGNPPWGYEFNDKQLAQLNAKYETARRRKVESYDVFTEKALKDLKEHGQVLFVLPEAILNVNIHQPIREFIFKNASLEYLEYLGNAFYGVLCPCIILQLSRGKKEIGCFGMEVVLGGKSYQVKHERKINPNCFSFAIDDDEYRVVQKIDGIEKACYLKNNAIFALGIVTGNNKKYVSDRKTSSNEIVLKGSDILKYRFRGSGQYIHFEPKVFQQVAREEYYRADEKLLYRFICNHLVFAYDDKKTLSLNSCNILIPRIKMTSCKYIMAILNSRVAQFYFKKVFNSMKVLRSHIEKIPIPAADEHEQQYIEKLVDKLRLAEDNEIPSLYEELDVFISKLYKLQLPEYQIIKNTLYGENNFLL